MDEFVFAMSLLCASVIVVAAIVFVVRLAMRVVTGA